MSTDAEIVADQLRQEWDCLSQRNAFRYIASLKENWTENEFLASGEYDVARLLDPLLARTATLPAGKTVVEIGCGVGRMSFALARRFAKVEAVDISAEMVRRAMDLQVRLGVTNVQFQAGSGKDLALYEAESADLCFSSLLSKLAFERRR